MDASTEAVWDVIRGVWRFAALNAFCSLDGPAHLADGPLTVSDLAARTGADGPSLARLLRTLAAMGFVVPAGPLEPTPRAYALTPAGEVLQTDLRTAVQITAEPGFWYAMGALPATVRDGRSAFVERFGPLYDYLAAHPSAGRMFDDYMEARASPVAAEVAAYDFSPVSVVMDVGGGKGHMLAAILEAHPHLRGTLFERSSVAPSARKFLADTAEIVEGDFFAAVPPAADCYLLCSIIHNWNDEDALRILRNVQAVLPENGRVLLLDMLLPDDQSPHIGKDLDIRMMGLFGGGRERTASEYMALLAEADLQVASTTEVSFGLSLIDARQAAAKDR